ncbi:MAG: MBL fold metallo-hydrolase [Acidimicrobiia bacterium]
MSPLPPVERLRPGLWSIPVPIPNNSLRYVYVYAMETDKGLYIVDVGWNTDDVYDALVAGLKTAGFSITDIKGMLVTHIHADHYGLAGRVREASGAWIALHEADAKLLQERYVEPDELIGRITHMMKRTGAPAEDVATLPTASMPVRPFVDVAIPDILLADGDKAEVPGWDVTAIWTPGHSPGHLCFWEAGYELMLSGDHVLPRITPNISYHPQAGDNPLGDYLRSLEKLQPYEAREVLPAHEYRFNDLQARIAQLRQHHEHRFAEVVDALKDGVTTAWEVASRMHWSRSWESLQGFMRRAAVSEALAHLRELEMRGVVRERVGEPSIWELLD